MSLDPDRLVGRTIVAAEWHDDRQVENALRLTFADGDVIDVVPTFLGFPGLDLRPSPTPTDRGGATS